MAISVQGSMAAGAGWMLLFKLLERSLGLVSTLILARLLLPQDFGTVAMAMTFVAMAELLAAFGFEVALIQDQQATVDHYNTAWTGNVLLGATVATLMIAAAVPIAHFYRRPELVWVVCCLATGPLISGAENIGVVAFRKDLTFRREFVFQLGRKLVGFCTVVPLAFWLRNHWALVAGALAGRLGSTVLSYAMHPFRPRFSLQHFRHLFRFSRWMLFHNIVGFTRERVPDLFIGRMFGATALGGYAISYEFANLPTTELSAPINRALLPGFAKMESHGEVASAYANAMGLLAWLAVPVAGGLFAVAPFFVPVVLGAKWLEVVPLMRALALNGVLLMLHSSMCAVMIARGHPARVAVANAIYLVVLLLLIGVLSQQHGIEGVAVAALLGATVATPVYLWQLRRSIGVGPMAFVRATVRPVLATAAMVLLVLQVTPAYSPAMTGPQLVGWLLSGIGVGALSYIAIAMSLWLAAGRPPGVERLLLDKLRGALAVPQRA